MRLPDEEPRTHYELAPSVITALIAVIFFVGILLGAVLLLNRPQQSKGKSTKESTSTFLAMESPIVEEVPASEAETLPSGSKLTPDDLDFWDKYPQEESQTAVEPLPEESEEVEEADPSTDGEHTRIVYGDGSEEWVPISPYLPKNSYDFTNLVCQSDHMKYFVEGKKVSYLGVDISKYQDYVDFVKVKKAGVDFVMLRVGARGYGTGQLVLDDYFQENIKRAVDAGLQVGAYFFSQAITQEEAIEEAEMVLEYLQDYEVNYPIAFDMEYIKNDASRIEPLTRAEKTEIAKAFLETVKEAGYTPMLYGNKEWLLKQIDLSKLTAYDIWLSQQMDVPEYPYSFTMWQYKTTGHVDGIAGYVDLNISFIDYAEK